MEGGGSCAWDAWSREFAVGREAAAFWPALLEELRPLVAARLPGRPHDWEDVLQETVVSLLEMRATGRFEPARGSVAALAASIARRRCADRLRAAARRPATPLDGERADPGPGPEEAVVQAAARRARREAFGRALRELQRQDARLGSRRAQALLLRYRLAIAADDHGFADGGEPAVAPAAWEEVAERMGISAEAARQNGSRGLRALRELWRAEGWR